MEGEGDEEDYGEDSENPPSGSLLISPAE